MAGPGPARGRGAGDRAGGPLAVCAHVPARCRHHRHPGLERALRRRPAAREDPRRALEHRPARDGQPRRGRAAPRGVDRRSRPDRRLRRVAGGRGRRAPDDADPPGAGRARRAAQADRLLLPGGHRRPDRRRRPGLDAGWRRGRRTRPVRRTAPGAHPRHAARLDRAARPGHAVHAVADRAGRTHEGPHHQGVPIGAVAHRQRTPGHGSRSGPRLAPAGRGGPRPVCGRGGPRSAPARAHRTRQPARLLGSGLDARHGHLLVARRRGGRPGMARRPAARGGTGRDRRSAAGAAHRLRRPDPHRRPHLSTPGRPQQRPQGPGGRTRAARTGLAAAAGDPQHRCRARSTPAARLRQHDRHAAGRAGGGRVPHPHGAGTRPQRPEGVPRRGSRRCVSAPGAMGHGRGRRPDRAGRARGQQRRRHRRSGRRLRGGQRGCHREPHGRGDPRPHEDPPGPDRGHRGNGAAAEGHQRRRPASRPQGRERTPPCGSAGNWP